MGVGAGAGAGVGAGAGAGGSQSLLNSQTYKLIPQLLLILRSMQPSCPQSFPYEFFTMNLVSSYPTITTAWLRSSLVTFALEQPQIPDLYEVKPKSAQIRTTTGAVATKFRRFSLVRFLYCFEVVLLGSVTKLVDEQMPGVLGVTLPLLVPRQGNAVSVGIPVLIIRLYASWTYPPPQLLLAPEHSSTYSSDRSSVLLTFIISNDSQTAVAENAQHAPQLPCCLTDVTLPSDLQSLLDGKPTFPGSRSNSETGALGSQVALLQCLSSQSVQSVKLLMPRVQPRFCTLMKSI